MEEVFVPDLTASFRWLGLCLVLGLAALALAVIAYRRHAMPLRVVAQLMGGLVALVMLGGAGFILWDTVRTPTIVVDVRYLLLGNDTIPSAFIERAYLESVSDYNLMGEPSVREVAIVRLSTGRVLILGAREYRVKELVLAVRGMAGQGG